VTAELAVDLGTATTRVLDGDGRVVLDEPTLAAIDADTGRILAFGEAAADIGARAAGRVHLVRPVRRGQLAELELAEGLLGELFRRAGVTRLGHPRVVACSHVGATPVQTRAFERALRKVGARQVSFVELPVAGAIGAGLAIAEPAGSMVVEIGAGTTDVGLLALGGLVTSTCLALGAEDLDAAVRRVLARRHRLVVDQPTATALREQLGSVAADAPELAAEVLGRDAQTGRPARAVIRRSELRPLLLELLLPVLEAVVTCISNAPPDLANDLLGQGIVLLGGASALDGLDRRLARATGLPVHLVNEPRLAAVRGALCCFEGLDASRQEPARRR
jgi:rod shape-determining protein MreB